MKDLQDWKKLPIDCLALSLYHLQLFYLNEIKRGLAGTGLYNLTENYLYLKSSHYAAECVSENLPQDIVKYIRTEAMLAGDSVGECSDKLPKLKSDGHGNTETQWHSDNGENRKLIDDGVMFTLQLCRY